MHVFKFYENFLNCTWTRFFLSYYGTENNTYSHLYSRPQKHLVEAVYCAGIKYGTYKNWLYLYNKSSFATPVEQNILWQALACNRDTWTLKSLLENTLEENVFRRSDIRRIYSHFSLTPISRSVYFDFVLKNWPVLLKRQF